MPALDFEVVERESSYAGSFDDGLTGANGVIHDRLVVISVVVDVFRANMHFSVGRTRVLIRVIVEEAVIICGSGTLCLGKLRVGDEASAATLLVKD